MEIKAGLKFKSVHNPNHSFEVQEVNKKANSMRVKVTSPTGSCWYENAKNLERSRWAFERGEYSVSSEK